MAEIKPFKGFVYNKKIISDLKDVTTPPYDVITKTEQDEFYKKNEYNVIRLILGKESEDDTLTDNRYTRAAAFLKDWLKNNVLVEDDTDTIYLYLQSYTLYDGTAKTRTGFIALTRIEDFSTGKILPHEKTLSGPRTDRLKLMESCHCNFSQIFSLYSDKERRVDRLIEEFISNKKPDMQVTDEADVTHTIFRMTDPHAISELVNFMKDNNLFIADGHHRYETALNFRNLMKKKGALPANSPYNYVMMYFANMDSDGLVVFPTHRVLFNLQDYQIDFLKAEIRKYFTVTDFPYTDKNEPEVRKKFLELLIAEGKKNHAFGMFCKGDQNYHLLVAEDMTKIDHLFDYGMAESLKRLDVTILHTVLIDHLLGVGTAAQENQQNLKYVKVSDKAIDMVKEEDYQVAFLLNPTKVAQVKAVAASGNKMPQKSTFFYPKLLTGLVINKLD